MDTIERLTGDPAGGLDGGVAAVPPTTAGRCRIPQANPQRATPPPASAYAAANDHRPGH
jgi:hypothetical protein